VRVRDGNVLLTFSGRVAALRAERGWTQAQVAEATGLTKSHISRIEKHEREPSATVVARYARVFEVSADYLLGLIDKR